ncbi:hypothetical protein J6590_104845 [Homalodisca vitripennis]|nr:hypothetical protein J6590_104845 [Homalodisca vitripennis]
MGFLFSVSQRIKFCDNSGSKHVRERISLILIVLGRCPVPLTKHGNCLEEDSATLSADLIDNLQGENTDVSSAENLSQDQIEGDKVQEDEFIETLNSKVTLKTDVLSSDACQENPDLLKMLAGKAVGSKTQEYVLCCGAQWRAGAWAPDDAAQSPRGGGRCA